MFKFLPLALLTLVICHMSSSQLLDEECLDSENVGHQRQLESTPWLASVYNYNKFICYGTLISNLFVLSSASCTWKQNQLYVRLGQYHRSCKDSRCNTVVLFGVDAVNIHRSFHPISGIGDIALLKLIDEVKYNAYIRPICIIMDDLVNSEEIQHLKGFGWHHKRQSLEAIQLTKKPHYYCDRTNEPLQICAENENNYCGILSGGPLAGNFHYKGEKLTVQFGLVSNANEFCESYGKHTNVMAYKTWLYNTISHQESQQNRVLYDDCSSSWADEVLVRLWEVSLFQNTFTGALVTNRFVVTVASAFYRSSSLTPVNVVTKYGESLKVESIHMHEEFGYSSTSLKNNIALLKLAKNVPNSDLVKPICIVINPKIPRTLTKIINRNTEDFMGFKKVTSSPVDNFVCGQQIGIPVESNQFCVEESTDFSHKTPGSILGTFRNISDVNRYILIGILSFDRNGMFVYTNIQSYVYWMVDTVNLL
ncbi:serine protease hepsin [Drosophila eugracilis]|uniref:serine protease hepsin n=1 Tax=Drosophila eugracilis TaxID=29029 RepID=UPI0007E7DBAD|nr:serine protease hepsin [Drosophila eugracilis]